MSSIEPRTIKAALLDHDWIVAMKEELDEFKRDKVWNLVPKPKSAYHSWNSLGIL